MQGEDKGLVKLGKQSLIEYVLQILTPQVGSILINANRNQQSYASYGHPVIPDELPGFQGPLVGFLAGLKQAKTDYLVTAPCDGPLLPNDLVERLCSALESRNAKIAVAHDGQRMQRAYALLSTDLRDDLESFLRDGERKVGLWLSRLDIATADFSDTPDAFRNLNTQDDCRILQRELHIDA